MRLWIDTEFNEFRGALISMALVAEDGQEWYAALECPNPGSWVAEHVMPLVGIAPVSRLVFCVSLRQFLKRFATVHIVADWPEDIEHFCECFKLVSVLGIIGHISTEIKVYNGFGFLSFINGFVDFALRN